ncbi:MAG: putative metal-binding motif-containing protein [Polyangiaceae bacterium]|nr:putative metal-binding motif-containing protein [Polyangiaceae bacterium]
MSVQPGRSSQYVYALIAVGLIACNGKAPPTTDSEPAHGDSSQDVEQEDRDQDGFGADVDCDDDDATVFPGAPEICKDGVVNDCDLAAEEAQSLCRPEGDIWESQRLLALTHRGAPADATSVAAAGDLNNDGHTDVLLGYSSGIEHEPGGFYILFGGQFEEDVADSNSREVDVWSAAVEPSGGDDFASLGWKAGTATDINNDGIHDFYVAAPRSNYDGEDRYEIDRGVINFYLGPVGEGEVNPNDYDFQLHGSRNEHLGYDVATGTFSESGQVAVLAAGLRHQDPETGTVALPAFLFEGPFVDGEVGTEEALVLLADQGSVQLGSWDRLEGGAVDMVDLDGDGLDDLVRGAPGESLHQSVGAAYVVKGSDTQGLTGTVALSALGTVVLSGVTGDHLGASIRGLDDHDGDGYDDLAVGAPLADHDDQDAGAVYLLPGGSSAGSLAELSTDTAYLTFHGHSAFARLGTSIGGLADVDSDGEREMLLVAGGAAEENVPTTAYIIYGPAEGTYSMTDAGAQAIIGAIDNDGMGDTARMSAWVKGLGDSCDDLLLGSTLVLGGMN